MVVVVEAETDAVRLVDFVLDSSVDQEVDVLEEFDRNNAEGVAVSDGAPDREMLLVLVMDSVHVKRVLVSSSDNVLDADAPSPLKVLVTDMVNHFVDERCVPVSLLLFDLDTLTVGVGDADGEPEALGSVAEMVSAMWRVASSETEDDANVLDEVTVLLRDMVKESAVPLKKY